VFPFSEDLAMPISDNLVGVIAICVAVGGPLIAWVIASIVNNWRQVKTSEHLAALKQTMVDKGMSAEEIERVIQAGLPAPKRGGRVDALLAQDRYGHER
jgi:hypothetical protein